MAVTGLERFELHAPYATAGLRRILYAYMRSWCATDRLGFIQSLSSLCWKDLARHAQVMNVTPSVSVIPRASTPSDSVPKVLQSGAC